MTQFSARGQQAADRASTRRKLRTKANQGRQAMSLGANDPRRHRTDQTAQATERQFSAEDFTVDKQGRLRLRK